MTISLANLFRVTVYKDEKKRWIIEKAFNFYPLFLSLSTVRNPFTYKISSLLVLHYSYDAADKVEYRTCEEGTNRGLESLASNKSRYELKIRIYRYFFSSKNWFDFEFGKFWIKLSLIFSEMELDGYLFIAQYI